MREYEWLILKLFILIAFMVIVVTVVPGWFNSINANETAWSGVDTGRMVFI